MRQFACPYCGKKAVRIWEFFILFSNFWINRTCRNCHRDIELNKKKTKLILRFFIIGILINLLMSFFAVDSILLFIIVVLLLLYIALNLDGRLFLKKPTQKNATE